MPGWKDQSYIKHRKAKPATHKPKGTRRDKHLEISDKDIVDFLNVLKQMQED